MKHIHLKLERQVGVPSCQQNCVLTQWPDFEGVMTWNQDVARASAVGELFAACVAAKGLAKCVCVCASSLFWRFKNVSDMYTMYMWSQLITYAKSVLWCHTHAYVYTLYRYTACILHYCFMYICIHIYIIIYIYVYTYIYIYIYIHTYIYVYTHTFFICSLCASSSICCWSFWTAAVLKFLPGLGDFIPPTSHQPGNWLILCCGVMGFKWGVIGVCVYVYIYTYISCI